MKVAINRALSPANLEEGTIDMKFIEKFFKHELAIDLGTVNTLIYDPDRGMLLNQPSVVAIDRYEGEVVSVGHEALKLLGREPRGIEVHRPIRSGTICNFEMTRKMLRTFLSSVTDGYRRGHFVVGIPGSATAVEQRSVRDAAYDAGGSRIELVDEGLAAGLGAGLTFDDERAHLVVDVGGGTTNIAIIASGGVVASTSLPAAGNAMDESIRDYIRSKYCLHIGECTAEAIKKDLGALTALDDPEPEAVGCSQMEVVGKHLLDGTPCAVNISAEEVREALEPILSEIVAGVRRIIEEAQPEAVADIYYSGVILTGGGSLLKGMKERLQKELSLHVSVPQDPITTVVVGVGTLLSHPDKLYRCAIRQNLPVWQASEELVVTW
jgi:rod shape-determining protein MreB and related proteins